MVHISSVSASIQQESFSKRSALGRTAGRMGSQHRPAPMDKGTTLALNLQVLKRLDPATKEVRPGISTSLAICETPIHSRRPCWKACVSVDAFAATCRYWLQRDRWRCMISVTTPRPGCTFISLNSGLCFMCCIMASTNSLHPLADPEGRGGRTISAAPQHIANLSVHHSQPQKPE